MNFKKIVLTGAAGFIGSNFVRLALENSDSQITLFDNFGYAANALSLSGLDESRVSIIKGDVGNKEDIFGAVREADAVVNFAAESHNDRSLVDPLPFLNANVVGTFNLLEAAKLFGFRYHHISTDEVFGDLKLDEDTKFVENSPYNPSSPYSSTKAAGDLLVRAWVRSFGVRATISNCSNNFGPRQHVEKFIPRQITNVLQGQVPRIYGSGQNVRDWIHVDEHNSAVWTILNEGTLGETYLVGTNNERSNLEIAKLINGLMGRSESEIEFVPDRAGHDLRYAIDSTKLVQELSWSKTPESFESQLSRTVDWYRANTNWWERTKLETELMYKSLGH